MSERANINDLVESVILSPRSRPSSLVINLEVRIFKWVNR